MSITYIYVGRRIQKGVLKHCFTTDEDRGSLTWWPKAKASAFYGLVIGTYYEVGESLPRNWSSVTTNQRSSEEDILKWSGLDKAEAMVKREKAIKPTPRLDRLVDDLRRCRHDLSNSQRVAFDVWLLNEIRSNH